MTPRACLFASSLGTCGLVWTERGLRALQLPEADPAATLRRVRRHGAELCDAPAPGLPAETVRRVQRHLEGSRDPLRDLALDLDQVSPFARQAYRRARQVGPGETVSYGEIARRCGRPGGAQAVGQAMARNPIPVVVPCHRIVGTGGGLGGFSAHGASATKLRLLSLEGADLRPIAEAGTRELARRDPRLGPVIRRVGAFELHWAQRQDHFSALAEAIVHQQVSMAAGATIFSRVLALAGDGSRLDAARLLGASPEPLRAAGLSRQKASYLQDLARRVQAGSLSLHTLDRIDDERVITELTQVKGIGRWSAEMFLIFRLGRLDVLPVDDLGLRKGAQQVYRMRSLPGAARLSKLGELWRPFRSVATWYLWRVQDVGGLSA